MEFKFEITNEKAKSGIKGIGGLAELQNLVPPDLYIVLNNYGGNEYFKMELEYEDTLYIISKV